MAGNGDPAAMAGCAIHLYAANRSMRDRFFYNADGELLIVPQQGRLAFATEFGRIDAEPFDIVVIPRGVRFRVELLDESGRGYVCENYGAQFRLPDLGVIGSNGLANPRDFLTPIAWYEEREGEFELVAKFLGNLWSARDRPFAARRRRLAWQLRARTSTTCARFNAIGSISYDHPDPSIFLVLQSQSDTPGVDTIDFVIFPPRILAMEHTFRPPWFHRNIASEFMGLIHGVYDAKAEGFLPGGASLHNCMTGHGPDADTFDKASTAGSFAADADPRHDGVHVRDARGDPADAARARIRAAAARVFPLLAGAARSTSTRRRSDTFRRLARASTARRSTGDGTIPVKSDANPADPKPACFVPTDPGTQDDLPAHPRRDARPRGPRPPQSPEGPERAERRARRRAGASAGRFRRRSPASARS